MTNPTYVPVIRTGVDVSFADVEVTGTLDVAGPVAFEDNLTVGGYTELASGQSNGQFTLWAGAANTLRFGTNGGGIAIAEGSGATSGVATLAAGTVTVPYPSPFSSTSPKASSCCGTGAVMRRSRR